MSDLVIKFDGIELTKNMGLIDSPDLNLMPPIMNTTQKIGKSHGEKIIESSFDSLRFPFVFEVHAGSIRETRDDLVKKLFSDDLKRLEISEFPNRYWMAKVDGTTSFVREFGNKNIYRLIMTFIIPDGVAYSTAPKRFHANMNDEGILEMRVTNNGNYEVPINYHVLHNHENGYIGVISQYGAAQIGNAQEPDTEIIERSEWVIRDDRHTSWQNNWENNQGYLTEDFLKNGSWANRQIAHRAFVTYNQLGNTTNRWNFVTKYRRFSPDSNGKRGSTSFTAQTRIRFENTPSSGVREMGIMSCLFANEDGSKKIGFIVHKHSSHHNRFQVKLYYNGDSTIRDDERFEFLMDTAIQNVTDYDAGVFEVKKVGPKISFTFGGRTYTRVNASLNNVEFENVTIGSGRYGGIAPVRFMDWDYMFVQVHGVNVDTGNDIRNSFIENSEIIIDNENSKYYYNPTPDTNNSPIPISDVVGSNWFKIPPGETVIQFYYSDFSDPPPTITGEIKEVY